MVARGAQLRRDSVARGASVALLGALFLNKARARSDFEQEGHARLCSLSPWAALALPTKRRRSRRVSASVARARRACHELCVPLQEGQARSRLESLGGSGFVSRHVHAPRSRIVGPRAALDGRGVKFASVWHGAPALHNSKG